MQRCRAIRLTEWAGDIANHVEHAQALQGLDADSGDWTEIAIGRSSRMRYRQG
jgi:hypothetical protein